MDQLINSISPASITAFFRKKAQKFRPETHSLDDLIPDQFSDEFRELHSLGTIAYSDSEEVIILSCRYTGELTSRSSKKKQYKIAKKVLKDEFKDAAIFVFFDKAGRFRFSFVRANYAGGKRDWSTWKRYTFFVRPDKPNKTFRDRIGKCAFDSIDAIQEAFSVEPLSKAFYKELSYWYFWAQKQVEFPNDTGENERTLTANAMIRMITRIIFIWFMKQKDLIPDELFDKEALDEIINYEDSTGSTYYKAILQNLFFATLNTPMINDRGENNRKFVNRQYGIQYFFRYERFFKDKERFMQLMENVPFLNGGLFENLDIVRKSEDVEIRIDCFSNTKKNEDRLTVPDNIFFGHGTADLTEELGKRYLEVPVDGLIVILSRYDFTIDENTPFDVEVALDPELLGLVFENLLASYNPETQVTARKESGSFYTPREIVNYMVETSLIQSLKTTTGLPEEKIDLLVRDQEAQPFDVAEDRGKLIKSISDLKILDPAVGSGAFPMGMLQKMVHILGKLDAGNEAWEKLQMDQALHDTEDAFKLGEQEERQTRLLEIEKAFDTAINEPDYARKLFLIENCLYGVDIQPIAVQICKLRFFISLLVDQKPDPAKDNFGIVALPNLETKFVAANTLIGLPKPMSQITGQFGSGYLRNTKIEELEKELETVRHKHFSARTPPTKEKHRKRDKELRDEIAELLVNDGWLEESARMVAKWDPYDQNASSDWFDPEWMFGFKSFDIVIGNPPYGAALTSDQVKLLDSKYRKVTSRTKNSAIYFIYAANDLLSKTGVNTFIVPKSLSYSSGWRSCLEFILPGLLGFYDAGKSFENVLLEMVVFVRGRDYEKDIYESGYFYNKVFNRVEYLQKSIFNQFQVLLTPQSRGELDVINKIIRNCDNSWGDYVDIQRGLNWQSRAKLSEGDTPVLRGAQLNKYCIDQPTDFIDLKDFEYSEYEYQLRPKILNQLALAHVLNPYPHFYLQAALDYRNMLVYETISCTFPKNDEVDLKLLLAINNSKIFAWILYKLVFNNAIRSTRFDELYISKIPCPTLNRINKDVILEKVNRIIEIKTYSRDVSTRHLESEIDKIIYSMYNLDDYDIGIIECKKVLD